MPNTKSAIRRVRRVRIQTAVNRIRKSKYKSALKTMSQLVMEKNKKKALAFLPEFHSQLMKTSKSGVINRKKISRTISRITKKIQKLN